MWLEGFKALGGMNADQEQKQNVEATHATLKPETLRTLNPKLGPLEVLDQRRPSTWTPPLRRRIGRPSIR